MQSINLIPFINKSVTPFHAVLEVKQILSQNGFAEISMEQNWTLEENRSYFTTIYDSTLIAFSIGSLPALANRTPASAQYNNEDSAAIPRLKMASAHTDFPCFRVKPASDVKDKTYVRLNVEPYGGLIHGSWLDRPLSVAGKIAVASDNVFEPEIRFLCIDRPLLTIPGLAIHMDREINKGKKLDLQKEMLPLFSTVDESGDFLDFLAKEAGISDKNDILDFDLYVFNQETGCYFGKEEEFISSPRLDNMTSVLACTKGILDSAKENEIHVIALYDNEEIGSRTKQGADSMLTNLFLQKLYTSIGFSNETMVSSMMKGFFLSLDVAHGYHPAHPEKNDITNFATLNNGICIKMNYSQKYATDTKAIAALVSLCQKHHISYQKYVNRSDIAGGGTMGSISSSWMPMCTADVGVPILSMHSARETMGAKDQQQLEHLVHAFFME
ncbi:MAG: M18 family aminopeptidase [Lachnospiraceae bacterium]|nr:M18 family aminopeptidase [Lachnospiraceae bacterium]